MCDPSQWPSPGAALPSGAPHATGARTTGACTSGARRTGACTACTTGDSTIGVGTVGGGAVVPGSAGGNAAAPGSAGGNAAAPGSAGGGAVVPGSAGEATAMVLAGLEWLASADVASWPASVLAGALRELEQAVSVHTVARARVLSAFTAQAGYEDDGQGSPRTWLTWQTRVTRTAASAAVAWARRLRAHPVVGDALATRQISQSWARQLCDWTDQLPQDARADADVILLAAATGGAGLDDLASLADQIRRRVAQPDKDDGDDGFDDRRVWLSTTLDGAGALHGDLTPKCAAVLRAVLDALGKKADRNDLRSKAQRDHDGLQEALTRLISADCLPDRAGQPTTILLHTTPDDFLGRAENATWPGGTGSPGGPDSPGGDSTSGRDSDQGGDGSRSGDGNSAGDGDRGRAGSRGGDGNSNPGRSGDEGRVSSGASSSGHGALSGSPASDPDLIPRPTWPGPAARPGDLCDARIIPIVTGQVNHDLLDHLAASLLNQLTGRHHVGSYHVGASVGPAGPGHGPPGSTVTIASVRELLLTHAIALLSGPGGLASLLRTGALPRPAGSVSLPLDVGTATDTIPPHLRRAVIARDRHCAAPGCDQPPAACEVHHIIPRSRGGPTSLTTMILLCRFHHLIMVHEWGWTITLNPDGTTTATSPDRTRQYHSHAPPTAAA